MRRTLIPVLCSVWRFIDNWKLEPVQDYHWYIVYEYEIYTVCIEKLFFIALQCR